MNFPRKNDGVNSPPFLSKREIDILSCLIENQASKKIAIILNISQKTVDTHIFNIMHKLGIHSRTNIVDYVKKTDKSHQMTVRYSELLAAFEFREKIKEMKKTIGCQKLLCNLVCEDPIVKKQIQQDLKNLNIICFKRNKKVPTIHFQSSENYYLSFFDLVYQLLPDLKIEETKTCFVNRNIVDNFLHKESLFSHRSRSFEKYWKAMIIGIIGICLVLLSFSFMVQEEKIRSDFHLPISSKILNRGYILKKIDYLFEGSDLIQTVALVGIGGSGKTTMARCFAKTNNAPVIWEINAETQESLLDSFGQLGFALSKTVEEKIELDRIKKTENQREYQRQLLTYVKRKLRQQKNWFLIFDNVANLRDIENYFPDDPAIWGNGKILITSRNANIAAHSLIKSSKILNIDFLTAKEKLDLFLKIQDFSRLDEKELIQFLKNIPPFPLDVSVAAYYLKNTEASYIEYLKNIESNNNNFLNNQRNIIQENKNYTKIRYDIIAQTIQVLLKKCPDFIKLLLLVSAIESKNIPLDLLEKLTNKNVTEQFVYHMKKYSLINIEKNKYQKNKNLFIHQSTQENIVQYCNRNLNKNDRQSYMDVIAQNFENYADQMLEKIDISKIRKLQGHLVTFLKQDIYLTDLSHGIVQLLLGRICHDLIGDYPKALMYLESSLFHLKQHYKQKNHVRIASALSHLGMIYKIFGCFEKSKNYLEAGMEGYAKSTSGKQTEINWARTHLGHAYCMLGSYKEAEKTLLQAAKFCDLSSHHKFCFKTSWISFYLGDLYSTLGAYKKAQIFYAQSLEMCQKFHPSSHNMCIWIFLRSVKNKIKSGEYRDAEKNYLDSLKTLKQHFPEDQSKTAWILAQLGDLYRILGLFEKSLPLLETGLCILKQCLGDQCIHVWWVTSLIGRVYLDMGQFLKAENMFENSIKGYKKNLQKNHILINKNYYYLAKTYLYLKKYKQAEPLFEKSLKKYEEHYGKDHIEYAQVLADFGYYYFQRLNYTKSREMILRALSILQKGNHPAAYRCHEYLGEIDSMTGDKIAAKQEYIKALEIAQNHLPKGSVHITRLKKLVLSAVPSKRYA